MITPKESNDTMEKEEKKGTAKVESPTLIKSKKEGVSIKEEEEEEVPPKVIAGKDKEKDKIDDEQSQKQPSENAKNETEKSNAGTENIDLFKSLTKVEFKSLVKEDDKDSAKDIAKNEVPKANIESVKSQVKEDVKDAVKPTEIKEEQKPELSNLIKSSVNEISKSTAKYNELKEEQKPEYDLETSLVKKDPSKNTEGNDEPKPNIDLVKSMIKETSISISKNNEGSKEEQNPNFDVFKSLDKDYDKDNEKSEMKPSSKIGSNIQNSPVKENVKSKILNKEISPVLTVKSKLKDKIKSTLESRKSKIDTVKSKLADKTQSKSRISSKIGDGKGPIGDMPNISLDKTPGIRTCADELCIERKGYLFKRETLKYTNRSFIYKAAGMTSVPVICKITLLDCYPPHVKENYLKNSTRIIRYVGGNGGEPPLSTFVRVYEIFQIDFKSYTFMNQVSSPSVLEMIKKRSKFSQEKARQWTRSLCDAVQFLQKRGIAHRGVKIDHVHFDQSQTLKLLGWGRSTFFWDETNGTYIQQVKESKSFANCHFPPEAFQGLYNPFYTDVWSIGVFLTAVHTRRHVFKVKSNISFASQWSAFEVTHRFSPHVLDLLRHIFVNSTLNRAKINWIMEHAYWNAPLNEIEQPKKTEKKGKTPATQTTTETVVQNDSSVKSRSKPIANKNGEDEDATEETETEPKIVMSKASLTSLARTEEDAFVISEKDDEISPFMFASDGSMDGPIGSQLILYQIAAIAIKCQHNSLLVSSLHSPRKSTGIWLPYVCVKEKYKCLQLPALIAEFILKQLNEPCDVEMMLQNQTTLPFEKVSLHDITRIQMPNGKFITRYTFIARWKCNEFSCCTDSLHLKWIPVNSIYEPTSKATTKFYQNLIERFWGSEVGLYAVENKYEGVRTRYNELSCNEVFRYVKKSDSDNNDNNGKTRNATTELFIKFVTDSKFMEKDVIRLYSDFIQHCYPSTNMSLTSFTDYCRKTGLGKSFESNKQFSRLFRAMNYKVKHYLTFNEFLLGLVCLDPESPHCLPRYTFIFRFYDSNQDGKLESNDLKLLLNDLSVEDKELSKSDLNLKQFIDEIESSSISKKFLKTSSLCRESNSIIRLLNNANVYDLISYSEKPFSSGVDTNCIKCRPKHYTLATHSVKLTSFGRIMTPKTTVFDADQNTPTMLKLLRTHSNEFIFKPSASANYVLEVTRKLANYNNKTEAERKDVRNEVVNAISASVITRICEEVCELLSAETRVLQVSTPTLVMGDIHGNMHDLLTFEMQLWPMAPAEIGPNVLFLGDYVDRGEFSIEVVLYLFCMKILAPNKFFLLRGNHEVRQIQKVFTFEKECLDKYGTHGPIVYETFNRAFDQLPFAAIIDESIYCAHGGIPCSVTSIEELNRQPSLLSDPEQEAPAVWEILWSDPITAPEYQQLSEFMNKKDGSGYLPNMKRSTAFYFSEIATNNFLKKNKLSRVIRAHEVINEGFRLNHRGSVITIFSCSRYCGGPNKAAAIVVEAFEQDGYLKIISLDT